MADIREVAAEAGVSTATVSRVVNGSKKVSDETRKKVEEAIRKTNYSTNFLGLTLRKQKTNTILVLVPTMTNEFFVDVINGVAECADNYGYNIIIGSMENHQYRSQRFVELAKSHTVDGIITTANLFKSHEVYDLLNHVPLVQCCGYDEDLPIWSVSTNDEKAASYAVQWLIDHGHKRIGYFGESEQEMTSNARRQGYESVLRDNGLPIISKRIYHAMFSGRFATWLTDSAKEFLKANPDMDAVLCFSDMFAYHVIVAAKEMGIRVPEDLSVVGFDNTSVSDYSSPKITTIGQNCRGIGAASMEHLYHQMTSAGPNTHDVEFIDYTFLEKESTRRRE